MATPSPFCAPRYLERRATVLGLAMGIGAASVYPGLFVVASAAAASAQQTGFQEYWRPGRFRVWRCLSGRLTPLSQPMMAIII